MGTALLALCFCALSLVLALFVGISPISDKAKARFMYVGYKTPQFIVLNIHKHSFLPLIPQHYNLTLFIST